MRRNRLSAAVLPILAMIATTAHAGTTPIDFEDTELGQIKQGCFLLIGPGGPVESITTSPPYFVRGIRIGPSSLGTSICDNVPGQTTPVSLPRTLTADEQIAFDIDLVPTLLGTFDRDLLVNNDPIWNLMTDVVETSGCTPSTNAHCLNDGRFKVRTHWRTEFGTRGTGPAVQGASTDDSGLFYFFNQDNWEVLLKVLNACSMPLPRFWVFSAATTNVEYTITVVDTEAQPDQVARSYFKPQGPPAPAITDTNAFATCP